MIRLGLVGWPLTHSLSPPLHAEAGRLSGLPVDYRLHPTQPAHLSDTLGQLQAAGLRGLNVTIPHKQATAAWVTRLDPLAARVGAVNTVVFNADGTSLGANTDVAGVRASLPPGGGESAVLVGAGGAARAALAALAERFVRVRVFARRLEQAQGLVHAIAPSVGEARPLSELPGGLTGAALAVDALPPHVGALARAPLGRMAPGSHVLSLNYGPGARQLLDAARGAGLTASDGLTMLAAQGVEAFRLWTGHAVPLPPVLRRLQAASRGD